MSRYTQLHVHKLFNYINIPLNNLLLKLKVKHIDIVLKQSKIETGHYKSQVFLENNNLFGSNIAQMTDIIVYSRKMLVRDFGFREDEAEKYIGLSLNIDNIRTDSSKESLENWMEVFSNSIKCIKISNSNDTDKINKMLDIMEKDNKDYTILLSTNSDLDEINSGYINLINLIDKDSSIEIEEKNTVTDIKSDKKMTNYIILGMIIATIVIICMMFVLKLR